MTTDRDTPNRVLRSAGPLLFATLMLGGCIRLGGREPPPHSLLTLAATARPATDATRSTDTASALAVMTPSAPQALATDRLLVTTGAGLAYLKGARWSDQPARLFADLLVDTLAARSSRVVLDRRQYAYAPGARLAGRLSTFGLDANRHEVVIVYDATLVPGGGAPLRTRRFEARRPAPSDSPEAVAQALDAAANDVAGAVADWVGP